MEWWVQKLLMSGWWEQNWSEDVSRVKMGVWDLERVYLFQDG